MSQKGLAPILIVLILAALVGGYLVYQKQTITNPKTTTPTPSATIQPTPTPQPNPTQTPKPTTKTFTPKITPTPTATATPLPSPSASPSPISKPSPVPGVYSIEQQPYKDIVISSDTRGYGISALLKDSNGAYIQDLSDYSFSWSIENPSIADLRVSSGGYDSSDCFSYAPYNIKAPCPPLRAELGPKSSGSTTVKVKVTKKSENKVIGEVTYNVTNK